MFVCLNGKFLRAEKAAVSVFDHGFLYGDGVYETLRTYDGRVWQMEEHLKRMEKSAGFTGLRLAVAKKKVAEWVEKLVAMNAFKDSRIRITLTRGVNGFDFETCGKPTLLIVAEKLVSQPSAVYSRGVKVVSVALGRVLPQAKSISLLPFILARQKMAEVGAYEALFVDEKKMVREGTITNVFMVKNGVVVTPRKNILLGTTRRAVMKVAKKIGVRVREEEISLRKLYGADEIFITNAPRGIVPVREVDGRIIADGKPGPLTQKLMKSFEAYVRNTLS